MTLCQNNIYLLLGDGLLTKEELQAAPWEFDIRKSQDLDD